MLCSKPFRKKGKEFGCSQCLPCRYNRRRVWTTRLMLESFRHQASEFATLTFAEEHLPDGNSLSVRAHQLFVKRLREYLPAGTVRFFGVGEYGPETGRPHYHYALFGLRSGHPDGWRGRCDPASCLLCRAWRYGDVHTYPLSTFLSQYLAGYVVDKLHAAGPYSRVDGRVEEFQRMSRGRRAGEGIGGPAAEVLARSVVDQETGEIHLVNGDVPQSVRVERKLWPLGRYMVARLRALSHLPEGQPAVTAALVELEDMLRYPVRSLRKEDDAKEQAREQGARIAFARSQISRSKKIL